jgi:hypothetical protein
MVERATSFSLIAYIVVDGRTYEGEASIVVLDKSEPPVTPPSISLNYPSSEIIVGSGTLLTIIGSVSQGSNTLKELQVLDTDSSVLQKWTITQPGDFRVDLSSFGSPGRKVLRLRAVDSVGLFAEASIPLLNDNTQLDSAARQFLRRYSCAGDGGTVRFGNLQTGPYAKPVKVYINSVQQWKDLIERACAFWSQYTGIQFEITTFTGSAEFPSIVIADYTNVDKPIVAETIRGYITDPHEIDATIRLYTGWLDENSSTKVRTLEHELGHAIAVNAELTEFGPMCIMWPVDNGGDIVLPLMQKAIRLLYENQPGWQP